MTAGYANAGALTPRMRQVLELRGQGLRAAAIARELGVAERTVRTIETAAVERLHVRTLYAAVYSIGRSDARS